MNAGDIIRVREWNFSYEFSTDHASIFSDPHDELSAVVLARWPRGECGIFLGSHSIGLYGEPMAQVFVGGVIGWVDEEMIEVISE